MSSSLSGTAHETRTSGHETRTSGPDTGAVATRRTLTDRQADTLEGLLDATAEELRDQAWPGLTVRNVARRAGVAPATAYTYFASREHLVTEVYRRRLRDLPDPVIDHSRPTADRAAAVLDPIALLVADEPELAAAVTVAMLSEDAEVRRLRDEIGTITAARLRRAVGDDASEAQLLTMESAFSGLLLRAGMGHLRYAELPERVADVAAVTLGSDDPAESGGRT